jgi:hypothetical protein
MTQPDRNGHVAGCACVRCRGFEPGNTLAVVHGATSERRIAPVAANHRRRLLRRFGLKAGDVDPIGRAYLDHYCRLAGKTELIDTYIAEHGMLRDDGEPQPCMRLYVSLHNSARLALQRLEAHLQASARDPIDALNDYLVETYGDGRDDDSAA